MEGLSGTTELGDVVEHLGRLRVMLEKRLGHLEERVRDLQKEISHHRSFNTWRPRPGQKLGDKG